MTVVLHGAFGYNHNTPFPDKGGTVMTGSKRRMIIITAIILAVSVSAGAPAACLQGPAMAEAIRETADAPAENSAEPSIKFRFARAWIAFFLSVKARNARQTMEDMVK